MRTSQFWYLIIAAWRAVNAISAVKDLETIDGAAKQRTKNKEESYLSKLYCEVDITDRLYLPSYYTIFRDGKSNARKVLCSFLQEQSAFRIESIPLGLSNIESRT